VYCTSAASYTAGFACSAPLFAISLSPAARHLQREILHVDDGLIDRILDVVREERTAVDDVRALRSRHDAADRERLRGGHRHAERVVRDRAARVRVLIGVERDRVAERIVQHERGSTPVAITGSAHGEIGREENLEREREDRSERCRVSGLLCERLLYGHILRFSLCY
jgi:hypothetical protein